MSDAPGMWAGRLLARAHLNPDPFDPSMALVRSLAATAGAGDREAGADALIAGGQAHPILQAVRKGAAEVLEQAGPDDPSDALARGLRRELRTVRAEAIMGRPALLKLNPTMQAEAGRLDRAILVELGRALQARRKGVVGADQFGHHVARAILAVTGSRPPGGAQKEGADQARAWLDRNLERRVESLNETLEEAGIQAELRIVPRGFELPDLPGEPPGPIMSAEPAVGAGEGSVPTKEAFSWPRGLRAIEDAITKAPCSRPTLIGFARWVQRLVLKLSALADQLTPGLRRWLILRV